MTRRGAGANSLARSGLILAVCLLSGLLGPHEEVIESAGAAIGLFLWACGTGARRRVRPVLAVTIGLPLALMLPSSEGRLAATAGIVLLGRPSAAADAAFVATGLAWRMIEAHAPIVWSTEVELSRGVSAAVGALTGQALDLGPSASGLDLLIVALLHAATHHRIRDAVFPVTVLMSGAAMMTYVAVLPLLGHVVLASRTLGAMPFGETSAGALFVWKTALLAVLCLVATRRPAAREAAGATGFAIASCATLSVILAALLMDPETSAAQRRPGRIVFLKSPVTDTRVPEHGRYGISRSGMFGLLPRYLGLDGHLTTLHEGPLTRRIIASASVLVVPLPVEVFSRSEAERIRDFVGRGGSLLVMGDHTDLLGIMKPLNELTGDWGIHFRFDSAYPAVNRWSLCLSGRGARGRRTGIGTGASLQIAPPARPVLVARYALSDDGDRSNGGAGAYLGNYAYDPGERLGDIVVAAVAHHGAGRIVVLGDTSSFQNIRLPTSYPFVASLMSDLAGPPRRAPWKDHGVAVLASVLAGLTLTGMRPATAGLTLSVLAGMGASAYLSEIPPLERLHAGGRVALVDSAHLNGYARSLWKPGSIGGLLVSLQREGFLPLMVEKRLPPGPWDPSTLAVLIEPRRSLHRSELRDLRAHTERGGDVLVAAGEQGGRALGPFLGSFGIVIGSIPLGPHPIRADMNAAGLARARRLPQFRRAHPVLLSDGHHSTSHYTAFGHDVVTVTRPSGAGRVIVLADPDFLTDRVLENEHDAWEGNVEFLSRLLGGERS